MKDSLYWIIAYRDIETKVIIGPVFNGTSKIRPVRWPRQQCPAGCEFAILPGNGSDEGVPDSVLQAAKFERKG
jgi:hypothetical protein